MQRHVVLGKGQIGSRLASALAKQGHDVRVVSRSGGVSTDGIEHIQADAADRKALIDAVAKAKVIYNCLNPAGYHRWAKEWPPISQAILDATEKVGADLVIAGNLYVYRPSVTPIRSDSPLEPVSEKGKIRVGMWRDALRRQQEGRIRVTEARASDYFGPGALSDAVMGSRVVPQVLAGKTVFTVGNPDMAHSFTYIPDMVNALVRLGVDEKSWGRSWHVPTGEPVSQRKFIELLAQVAGVKCPRIVQAPWWILTGVAGTFAPHLRGLKEIRYQWDQPFVMESADFTDTFSVVPTGMTAALGETIDWWRQRIG